MQTCENCGGEGLVGVGENPRLKIGNVSTCSLCAGSGKVSSETPSEPESIPQQESTPEPENLSEGSSDESRVASDKEMSQEEVVG